jgi:hypothetical protein
MFYLFFLFVVFEFLASFHYQSRIARNIISHTVLLSAASYQTFCKFSFVVFVCCGCLAVISLNSRARSLGSVVQRHKLSGYEGEIRHCNSCVRQYSTTSWLCLAKTRN